LVEGSEGPILPVVVGEDEACMQYERRLRDSGVRTKAIRPPTVAPGEARVRVTLRASMSAAEALKVARALAECRP